MNPTFSRRGLLLTALLAAGIGTARATSTLTRVDVWKSPDCTCCGDWIRHLQANGFDVTVHADHSGDGRRKLRMPAAFTSCHTALIGGYAVEGHVPAREIRRVLAEKPKALGLAVPGMPFGSPGMDGPQYNGRKTPFDVLLVQADGRSSVYQPYR